MHEKARAIEHAAQALKPVGVLHGATILGQGVEHNGLGRYLMKVYNKKGIFCNTTDSYDALKTVLECFFEHVTLRQHGVVALFTATDKIHQETLSNAANNDLW
jgi:hypothetical protein